MSAQEPVPADAPVIKQCCAQLYESEAARWLLGESFHPGGLRLTERLGAKLGLTEQSRVLDVAAGKGASALLLAERFGCSVTGVDFSHRNVQEATQISAERRLTERVRFEYADAEALPFPDASFDAVVCECAFCTFPDKTRAAGEFARVLRPGGRVGLSDLTRCGELPEALCGLLAWIACIADAQPIETYNNYLTTAGFSIDSAEPRDEALKDMVRQAQGKLLALEALCALGTSMPVQLDLTAAKGLANAAREAIEHRQLGYVLITATAMRARGPA